MPPRYPDQSRRRPLSSAVARLGGVPHFNHGRAEIAQRSSTQFNAAQRISPVDPSACAAYQYTDTVARQQDIFDCLKPRPVGATRRIVQVSRLRFRAAT
eukprot:gene855-17783_t